MEQAMVDYILGKVLNLELDDDVIIGDLIEPEKIADIIELIHAIADTL